MGKFGKRFYFAQIPEWRGQYIDYKSLYQQIKVVKAAVLELAQAYAHIKGTELATIRASSSSSIHFGGREN
jgi:SPX domain protein involved in polyphosphate accumulation